MSGSVFSLLLVMAIVLYFINAMWVFIISVMSAAIIGIILADPRPKNIFFEIVISIVPAIIMLLVLFKLDIVGAVFRLEQNEETELTGGDGLGIIMMIVNYIVCAMFFPFLAYEIGKRRKHE